MAPEEVQEFPPAGVAESAGGQITDSIDLDCGYTYPVRFGQRPAQRQTHRFQSNSDLHFLFVAKTDHHESHE
jgi:hypothetical protein